MSFINPAGPGSPWQSPPQPTPQPQAQGGGKGKPPRGRRGRRGRGRGKTPRQGAPGNPVMDRLSTNQWEGYSSMGPDHQDTWVTVPVDKVIMAGGSGVATPVFAQSSGYGTPQDAGNQQGQSMPQTPMIGRPPR